MTTTWLLPEFLVRAAAGLKNGTGSSSTSGANDPIISPGNKRGGISTTTTSDLLAWQGSGCPREGTEAEDLWCTSPHQLTRSDCAALPKIAASQAREDETEDLTVQMLDCCAEVGDRLRELVIDNRAQKGAWQFGSETDATGEDMRRRGGRGKVSRGTQSGGPRVSRGTQSCTGVLHHVEDYMEDVYCVAKVLTDPNASETKIMESLRKLESLPISTAVLEYLLAIRHCRLERCHSGDMWLCCWPWAQVASPKAKTKHTAT